MKTRLPWAAGAILVYLMVRLPGLMSLPIYCDESIYLRYAQLIHGFPLSRAFVSLLNTKPPLHYWLLALVFGWTADPLLAARLVSVLEGALSVAMLFPLSRELMLLERARLQGKATTEERVLAPIACAFFVSSPFLAFYQRMALAECLLVAESLLVVWLSLVWARRAEESIGRFGRASVALGLALG